VSRFNGKEAAVLEVRASPLHGLGVFAARRIHKGTRIIEYLGERVSHAEADRRYAHKNANDAHTFLFIVDAHTVIDAGVGGNEARFVNHCCEPNCESVIEDRRVFIEAVRTIRPGEELTYDYQIQREADDPPDVDAVFACCCGSARCRGSMLWPPRRLAARRRTTARSRASRR
jgi:SET domain-containing protein